MSTRTLVACLVMCAPAMSVVAQGRPVGAFSWATAAITGSVHGVIPPTGCAPAAPVGSGSVLSELDETTSSSAPSGSGTFELTLPSVCVAPFFQALIAREPLSVQLAFGESTSPTPTLALSLANAKITHVDLSLVQTARPAWRTHLKIGLAAPTVTSPGSGGAAVANPAAPAGSGSAAAAAAANGGALSTTVKPATVALAGGVTRARAPSLHIAGTALTQLTTAATAGAGSSWATHGVGGMNVHLAAGATDASFFTAGFHLGGRYPVDGSGMPTGNLQLTLDPVVKSQDAKTAQIKAAATSHAILAQAVFSIVGQGGSPAGITVSLRNAQLIGDQATSGGSNSVPIETLQFTVPGLTITDIASGRTAATP